MTEHDGHTIDMGRPEAPAVPGVTPSVREYRVLFDDEDGQAVLLGPCAYDIGCLFDRKFSDEDGVTLGALIDAAAEHAGEDGDRAHARLAEMAAEWDAWADARNAELVSQPTAADRAMVARATGGGIRSREVQPEFGTEGDGNHG